MLELKLTAQFRRDYKLMRKRGYDTSLLADVLNRLRAGETPEAKYRDHSLTGNMAGQRECHVRPDWLLIYEVTPEALILTAVRTGTHADLLGM